MDIMISSRSKLIFFQYLILFYSFTRKHLFNLRDPTHKLNEKKKLGKPRTIYNKNVLNIPK